MVRSRICDRNNRDDLTSYGLDVFEGQCVIYPVLETAKRVRTTLISLLGGRGRGRGEMARKRGRRASNGPSLFTLFTSVEVGVFGFNKGVRYCVPGGHVCVNFDRVGI